MAVRVRFFSSVIVSYLAPGRLRLEQIKQLTFNTL